MATKIMRTEFNSKDFTFSAKNATLVAEASDLGWPAGLLPRSIKVDGWTLTLVAEKYDREGEVIGWEYKLAVNPNYVPNPPAWRSVMVLND